jgi:hypothetical protein
MSEEPIDSIKYRKGLDIIERSGNHLLTLINDILDLAKIEAGRLDLYHEPFNLDEFLNGLIDIFKVQASRQDVEIIYNPIGTIPKLVYGDAKRLRQILYNLMGNAVKFTDEGTVKLVVQSPSNNKIRFDVIDSGVGIAPEDFPKIFQSFEQVGDATKMQSGTGLGLAISKRLIEMMGGELNVKSSLGQGSTFWLEIDLPTYVNSMRLDLDSDHDKSISLEIESNPPLASNEHTEIVLPSRRIILELLDIAEMGSLEPLQEYLTQLEKSDVKLQIFTGEVMKLIKAFQLRKIINYLNDLMAE